MKYTGDSRIGFSLFVFLFVLVTIVKIADSLTGNNSFTIVVNPYIVGIKAYTEPDPANWFDKIKVYGWSVWPDGDPFNETIEIYYNNIMLCKNRTQPEGYFECYFIANKNFTIGDHVLTVYAVNESTQKVLGTEDITFRLYPHFGEKPKNDVIVVEVPSIAQDINGKIKKVLVRIFFGY